MPQAADDDEEEENDAEVDLAASGAAQQGQPWLDQQWVEDDVAATSPSVASASAPGPSQKRVHVFDLGDAVPRFVFWVAQDPCSLERATAGRAAARAHARGHGLLRDRWDCH